MGPDDIRLLCRSRWPDAPQRKLNLKAQAEGPWTIEVEVTFPKQTKIMNRRRLAMSREIGENMESNKGMLKHDQMQDGTKWGMELSIFAIDTGPYESQNGPYRSPKGSPTQFCVLFGVSPRLKSSKRLGLLWNMCFYCPFHN